MELLALSPALIMLVIRKNIQFFKINTITHGPLRIYTLMAKNDPWSTKVWAYQPTAERGFLIYTDHVANSLHSTTVQLQAQKLVSVKYNAALKKYCSGTVHLIEILNPDFEFGIFMKNKNFVFFIHGCQMTLKQTVDVQSQEVIHRSILRHTHKKLFLRSYCSGTVHLIEIFKTAVEFS